ncbi:hypothetical protein CRUP_012372, partial [Coryphaenoides rupestris]
IHHKKEDPQDRFKVLVFKISDGEIGVDHVNCVQVKDTDDDDDEPCGLKHDWQVNDVEDIFDEEIFMEKLGTGIVKLEKKHRKERKEKCKKAKCHKGDDEQQQHH